MFSKFLLIAILAWPALFCEGCDGAIKVKGKVYTQTKSSEQSQAFVDEPAQLQPNLVPVKDATVTVYHGADYSERPIDKSTVWQSSEKTGPQGEFEVGGTTSPSPFHAALVVEKEGYKPVTKIFLHDKLAPHEAIIILVPDNGSNPKKQ
jgi:hypothetical protein